MYVLLLFVIFYLFLNDFRRTNYRKIYQTDLRQIFRVGRTMCLQCFDAVGWAARRASGL